MHSKYHTKYSQRANKNISKNEKIARYMGTEVPKSIQTRCREGNKRVKQEPTEVLEEILDIKFIMCKTHFAIFLFSSLKFAGFFFPRVL